MFKSLVTHETTDISVDDLEDMVADMEEMETEIDIVESLPELSETEHAEIIEDHEDSEAIDEIDPETIKEHIEIVKSAFEQYDALQEQEMLKLADDEIMVQLESSLESDDFDDDLMFISESMKDLGSDMITGKLVNIDMSPFNESLDDIQQRNLDPDVVPDDDEELNELINGAVADANDNDDDDDYYDVGEDEIDDSEYDDDLDVDDADLDDDVVTEALTLLNADSLTTLEKSNKDIDDLVDLIDDDDDDFLDDDVEDGRLFDNAE